MRTLISSALILSVIAPLPALSQQINTYQVCHTYQERYSPGYYASNGSYVQGGVYTIRNNVNCQTGEVYSSQPYNGNGTVYQPPVVVQRQRVCNPIAGAAIGYGIANALSNGGGWKESGKWNRYHGRRHSSGSWSNSYRNRNGWGIFGAGVGSILFGC
jgi:hypothetical protein